MNVDEPKGNINNVRTFHFIIWLICHFAIAVRSESPFQIHNSYPVSHLTYANLHIEMPNVQMQMIFDWSKILLQ